MYQYSFANVDLILEVNWPGNRNESTLQIKGFGTGEGLINIARRAPIAEVSHGAYGDMVVNMQRIRSGDLSFPVLMSAPENQALQDWANYFQQQADADGQLIQPIQGKLVDNMGRDACAMRNGVILAMPAMVRGQMMNTVTWVITFETVTFVREIGSDYEAL